MQIKCISSRANTKYWFKWNALYDDHLKESPSRRKRKEFEKRKASRRKCTKSGQTNFFFFYFCSVVFSLHFSTVFFFVFLLWWAVASLFAQEQQMRWSSAWQWNFWRTCTKRCTPCCPPTSIWTIRYGYIASSPPWLSPFCCRWSSWPSSTFRSWCYSSTSCTGR